MSWSEPTETEDISTGGILFYLNERVSRAQQLRLKAHRPDGTPVSVGLRVVHVTEVGGRQRIGAAVAPPMEEWHRLFVSWVADEHAQTESL